MSVNSAAPELRLITSEPPSDAELCRSFLKGDRRAFEELVRRYQQPVYRLIRRWLSHDDALDVVQRAFLSTFHTAQTTFGRFEAAGKPMPFRAWLFRTALNDANNLSRNRKTQLVALASNPVRVEVESAQSILESAQSQALIKKAVKNLPERQRHVFGLRIDAGLAFAEIAEALGITESAAKSNFHYAVKSVRAAVQEELGHGDM